MSRPGFLLALLAGLALTAAADARCGEDAAALRAERDKAAALRLKAMEAARRAFVKVTFTPRWDRDCALEAELGETGYNFNNCWIGQDGGELLSRLRHLLDMHRERQTSSMPGLLIGPGLVAITDDGTGYEWRLVGKVEVEDASGKRWLARPHALLAGASAILLKCEGDDVPSPPEYRKDFELSPAAGTLGVSLTSEYTDPDRWRLLCGGAYAPFGKEPVDAEGLEYPGSGSLLRNRTWSSGGITLLFDSEARPAALNAGNTALTNSAPTAWRPGDILAKGLIPYPRLLAAEKLAREKAGAVSYRVRFEFRVDKGDDRDARFGGWARRRSFMGPGDGAEDAEAFGISVGGDRLLVPRTLKADAIRKIEKVSVRAGKKWVPAKFRGALKDYDAMVVDVPGAKLSSPADLYAGGGVRILRPFVFCTVRRVLGRTDAFAKTVRYLAMEKGYGDRLRPSIDVIPPGSLLYGLDGKLAGMCIRERRERELAALTRRRRIYMQNNELKNLLPFARLKAALQAPERHSLPTWRPMSEEEAKRLVWLGVEFDPITRDLARRLHVEQPTCAGAVGLMVSTVYPGSPAARIGIQPRDILLHLKVKDMGDPLALASAGAASGNPLIGRMMGMGGPMADDGAVRTWKPRANVLTMLLTDAGPGHDAEITYYSHSRKKTLKGGFRLAYGPVDYDSAEKHKDEGLGLSVKPLTYEVRRALAMRPEDPGVIICKVEEGSPAQLARLQPYTVVTHVDNEPVKSTAEFAAVVTQLRKAKKDKVKLQVSVMGKSRFADLKLK